MQVQSFSKMETFIAGDKVNSEIPSPLVVERVGTWFSSFGFMHSCSG